MVGYLESVLIPYGSSWPELLEEKSLPRAPSRKTRLLGTNSVPAWLHLTGSQFSLQTRLLKEQPGEQSALQGLLGEIRLQSTPKGGAGIQSTSVSADKYSQPYFKVPGSPGPDK